MANGAGQNPEKAQVFFTRGRQAAQSHNFDYAIEMYLDGLRSAPDAVEEGHLGLRELAVSRQSKGGKKPSMMEKMKLLYRKQDPLEQMLAAEHLLAKDPDNLSYAEAMLKAAVAGGYKRTARWMADFIFQANSAAEKPSFQTYQLLKNSYDAIGEPDRAVLACERAFKLKPDNEEISDEFKRVSAEQALARGKYAEEGDFRKAIKGREAQEKLHAQAGIVKTHDYRITAVEEARKALAADSNLSKNILSLAKALAELQSDEAENEAIELLEDAYERKSDFSFKQNAGEIKIKQLNRKVRAAKSVVVKNPNDFEAKVKLSQLFEHLNTAELEHYRLCVENYPTDPQFKYEYGLCLLKNKRYDEAIPMLQEAQRDPARKIAAMNKTGLCFFLKGWFTDAIDIFSQAIEDYEIKDDDIAKELRYNLARSYEQKGDAEKAIDLYRRIAQIDFAYKDVSQRVDKLRNQNK
jgi:tetratricopeptide (TPR) repeat protein